MSSRQRSATRGHPIRVRALELLGEREHSVGEMLPRSGVEVSRVFSSLSSPQVAVQLAVARRILTTLLADQQQVLKTTYEQWTDHGTASQDHPYRAGR